MIQKAIIRIKDRIESILMMNTYESNLRSFFRNQSYDPGQEFYPPNPKLKQRVSETFMQRGHSPEELKPMLPCIAFGCDTAHFLYQKSPFDIQVYVGVYTALFFYFEDTQSSNVERLQHFAKVFGQGSSHGDPHYDHFASLLIHDTPQLFGPYATACIINSSLDMIASCGLEYQFPKGFSRMTNDFPSWLRSRTGNGESYAWFNFPKSVFSEDTQLGEYVTSIKGIAEWIDLVNDVLSYHKEMRLGNESNNLLANQARARKSTPLAQLRLSCKRIEVLKRETEWVLQPCPDAVQAVENFREGYIMFHCAQPRYDLAGLGIGVRCRG
ncbi:hypothetical protein N7494_010826 [Penicillium frequentans]|uniref:Trichodiene synthase n=1 Tax=Penicillium frequentans TaxID=3151616 RepID=A0AAD6CJ27_9EURO|nr:hypothetical protein N7494_010826 [Penicillium glabrum]